MAQTSWLGDVSPADFDRRLTVTGKARKAAPRDMDGLFAIATPVKAPEPKPVREELPGQDALDLFGTEAGS